MKILFIYPSTDSQAGFNYGVAHMAALLKRAGHQVGFWQLCEEIEPLPVPWEEALRMARDGRIIDAKTLIGLLYYESFRRLPAGVATSG